jgi:hypothetical protein
MSEGCRQADGTNPATGFLMKVGRNMECNFSFKYLSLVAGQFFLWQQRF